MYRCLSNFVALQEDLIYKSSLFLLGKQESFSFDSVHSCMRNKLLKEILFRAGLAFYYGRNEFVLCWKIMRRVLGFNSSQFSDVSAANKEITTALVANKERLADD
jgi:hypothetical protein